MWPEFQVHSFYYWIPPIARKRRKLSAKKVALTLFSQTSLFHVKVVLQLCVSHKNLGLRLTCQPLKCSIMQREKKEKEKNEIFRMAVGKLLALAGSFVAFVVLVSLSHYYLHVKLILFILKKKGVWLSGFSCWYLELGKFVFLLILPG